MVKPNPIQSIIEEIHELLVSKYESQGFHPEQLEIAANLAGDPSYDETVGSILIRLVPTVGMIKAHS